jgi:hypothetical protein
VKKTEAKHVAKKQKQIYKDAAFEQRCGDELKKIAGMADSINNFVLVSMAQRDVVRELMAGAHLLTAK